MTEHRTVTGGPSPFVGAGTGMRPWQEGLGDVTPPYVYGPWRPNGFFMWLVSRAHYRRGVYDRRLQFLRWEYQNAKP